MVRQISAVNIHLPLHSAYPLAKKTTSWTRLMQNPRTRPACWPIIRSDRIPRLATLVIRPLVPRSPAPHGIAQTVSRLNFARARSPPRFTWTCKIPTPRSDSPNSWISISSPTSHLRLNDNGRALDIEHFLNLCNVPQEDHLSRGLIKLCHINQWDYFLDVSSSELEKLNFPHPLASQLMKGARWLIPTHTVADNAVSLPTKARGAAIEATTDASAGSTSAPTSVTPVIPTPATAITGPQAASDGPAPPEGCYDDQHSSSEDLEPSPSAILRSMVPPTQEI
ncbi:hypothetical protein PTTG_01040 [Puccinia triticina 1-1 BBBD Race 1]|uniref:SAM domain-containing protein n=1 Tax=Puccinia triticina (isolate 1-1 / race 1 (BBBD)) TaxID=630390 RepID=A0A180G2W6_PUCT1|nr:hypothetical protein PTTG_01040 [Puccinia triticina 1-1 BBBD Race 1]